MSPADHPSEGRCAICGKAATRNMREPDVRTITCKVCGSYRITGTLEAIFGGEGLTADEKRLVPYLSAATREASEGGQLMLLAEGGEHAWGPIARRHQSTPLRSKAHKLLRLVADRCEHPGATANVVHENDYPLVDAGAPGECAFLGDYLENQALLRIFNARMRHVTLSCTPTVLGWDYLTPLGGEAVPGRAFVAMWFDPSMDDAFAAIEGAISACGGDPIRVDRQEHNDDVTDRILAEIRSAEFVIAEFTGQRQGVYFEAGFARGLGREVIWIVREDEVANLHFDTNHLNHITWKTPQELREKLENRIRATIGSLKPEHR